jgi:branched-subunit amino acid aminotransferase/4-amino-4-deoxychorismate lyase
MILSRDDITWVRAEDGQLTPFDERRLAESIQRAAELVGHHDWLVAESVAAAIRHYVAECTGDNVFMVHKGRLFTPAAQQGALKGITRETIFDIAKDLGLPLEEHDLTRYDLWNGDECFLTGTGAEVIAVVKLDAREIGSGKPGPTVAPSSQNAGQSPWP